MKLVQVTKDLLFTDSYLMSLNLIQACSTCYTMPLYKDKDKVAQVQTNPRKAICDAFALLSIIYVMIFCIPCGYRLYQSLDEKSPYNKNYSASEKLMDSGWLTIMLICFFYKVEFNRLPKEIVTLLNSSYELEKRAIAKSEWKKKQRIISRYTHFKC